MYELCTWKVVRQFGYLQESYQDALSTKHKNVNTSSTFDRKRTTRPKTKRHLSRRSELSKPSLLRTLSLVRVPFATLPLKLNDILTYTVVLKYTSILLVHLDMKVPWLLFIDPK